MTNLEKLQKVLGYQGGLYSLDSILQRIADGRMQSWSANETWVVTEVIEYPLKKVVNIFLVVGDLRDALAFEPQIEEFARSVGADMVTAYGRPGWEKVLPQGWKQGFAMFSKEL